MIKLVRIKWVDNAAEYANSVNMDKTNEEALMILGTQGDEAFLKRVFTETDKIYPKIYSKNST